MLLTSFGAATLLFAALLAGSEPAPAVREGTVEGVVRDRSGAPMAGVLVEGRDSRPRPPGRVWDAQFGFVRATTDAQGRFRLTGVGALPCTVTAAASGRGRAQRRSVRAGARVELVLLPSASVTGSVAGPDGRAAGGALVRIEPDSGSAASGDRVAVVDAGGRFEFPGVEPGSYRLVARHPALAPAWQPVVVKGRADAEASLRLRSPVAVTGRLVDAQARPVRGRVGVRAVGKTPPPASLSATLSTETAADGTFRLEAVPAGAVTFTAGAARFAARRLDTQLAAGVREHDLGTVALETGVVLSGFVRDRRGQPVPGARVTAEGAALAEDTTAADGSFVLAGLECARCGVSAQAPGFAKVDREVAVPGEGVVLVLQETGTVTGVVVDSAGVPVTGYQVVARPQPSPSRFAGVPTRRDVESTDGRFTLEGLAADTYVLAVVASDREPAGVSNVVVGAGGVADVGEIRLRAGGIVRGTVVDGEGAAVAGATVRAAPARRMMGALAAGAETGSGADGAFELRGVPGGSARITARHPDYAEGEVVVDIEPARGPAETQVILRRGGRLQGHARRRDGSPVTGVVSIQSFGTGSMPFTGAEHVSIAADSTFSADHVPAGRARLVLMAGPGLSSGPERQVEVREGQATPVEFDLRDVIVSGRVSRSGSPAPGLRITLTDDRPLGMSQFTALPSTGALAGVGSALTRADGSYDLIVDEPGRARITVAAPDGSLRLPPRTADIPDVQRHVLDLDFGSVILAGIIVDEQTDAPLAYARVLADPHGQITRGRAVTALTEADGRFQVEVEPGRYRVSARVGGYAAATTEVEVQETRVSDLRLPLTRGATVRGRVVDPSGRPAGDGIVRALSPTGASTAGAPLLPDGRFELTGLTDGEYSLLARSDTGGFALRAGVLSGTEDVTLVLRRGGRIQMKLVGPDGAPVADASASVSSVDGAPVAGIAASGLSSEDGVVTIQSPTGAVELRAAKLEGPVLVAGGSVMVVVEEGSTTAAEVVLVKPAASLQPQ